MIIMKDFSKIVGGEKMKIFITVCIVIICVGVIFGLCGMFISNAEKKQEKKGEKEYAQFTPKNKTDF